MQHVGVDDVRVGEVEQRERRRHDQHGCADPLHAVGTDADALPPASAPRAIISRCGNYKAIITRCLPPASAPRGAAVVVLVARGGARCMLPAAVRMPAMCHPLASLHATRRLVRVACCVTHAATLHVACCRCMSYVASGRRLQQRALVGEERLRLDLDRLLRLIRIGPQCRAAAAAAAWAGGLLSGLAALPGGPEGLGDRKRALVATARNRGCNAAQRCLHCVATAVPTRIQTRSKAA